MIRAVVIDDEPYIREVIKNMLAGEFPGLVVSGEAGSVDDGIRLINSVKPNLLLMDIEIIGGKAFDILKSVSFKNFKVIFITAHDEYAIRAIKFSAIDYILKPIDQDEFVQSVDRALKLFDSNQNEIQMNSFLHNLKEQESKKLVLRTLDSIFVVNLNEIVRCESDNAYTTFYIKDGEKITVSKGIKEYTELLMEFGFLRPHQSHLVNLEYVKRFDKTDGGFLILKDGVEIPVASRRKQQILQILNSF